MNNKLKKIGKSTYCLDNPVNIGFYLLDDNNICLIDTGSSKDYAKLIEKILTDNNWNLKYIINTHSHADHIGGNYYLQKKYNCKIYSSVIEASFISNTILEPALMYGANPIKSLYNRILHAASSNCNNIADIEIDGIKIIDLSGHSPGQIGILTDDNVFFVGDAYTSKEIIEKYSIQYMYDVKSVIEKLNYILSTDFKFYVPSHGLIESKDQAFNTIEKNKIAILKNMDIIKNIIESKISYNDLLKKVFSIYKININAIQYHVISATIKSFLRYLEQENLIEIIYDNNEMIIKSITT